MRGPTAPVRSAVFVTATTEAYGSTLVLKRHAAALLETGVEVSIVHDARPDADSAVLDPVPDGLADLHDAGARIQGVPGLGTWRSLVPFGRIARAVAELRPDVVVSTQLRVAAPTAVIARRNGVPHLALVQNHPRFSGRRPIAKLKWVAYRWALRSADRVVCVAPGVAAIVESDLEVDPARIGVVPNLIDIPPVTALPLEARSQARAEIRRSLAVADDEFLIVHVGRFHRQKGQLDLVDALAVIDDRRAVIVFVGDVEATGSDGYLAEVRRRVAEAGLEDRVRWAGFRSDVPAVLDAADLYVSSSRWEAGPSLALLEAMAAECAVVATDHGDRVEGFVDDEHGRYVRAGDAADLARGIGWMMERPVAEREEFGRNARRLVMQRDQELVAGPGFLEQVELAAAGTGPDGIRGA